MMTIKTVQRAAIALASATALSSTAAFAQDDGKTFALVQINQQALFFNEMNRGAQEAADELGVELVIFNANNEAFEQNSAIETYITQGVDGIAVVAIDVNGIMPAVEQADAAGIPVVAIDAILPEGPQAAQIGVDNAQAGADLASFIGENMESEEMSLGVVGALNSYIQNVRRDGFVDNLPEGVSVVNTVDGQNIQDVALNASENLLTANPGMNAIYGTGEPALMGAIAAVTSQGRTEDISIYGWDLTEQVIQGIDDGYVKAVVQQDPAQMGAEAIRSLNTLADGGEVESEISVPVTIVTQDNVDDFRSLFE
ncbi:D-ribose-binding periplasmic protein precursor [Roseivivax jejudonensis]|uniref:D-ribose-binding periplasmic protein n=1 Tax=Roseivivax jejudonensis TaxID=1529041 RepID=A0A1X6Y6Z4_9RHOB|nr:substrate-binding domain-containing protein [Roseivivax jejudonensis]SLN10819.1 D-ribose-binding periplasmic protein precursor [Roseivivax jejudonensis]